MSTSRSPVFVFVLLALLPSACSSGQTAGGASNGADSAAAAVDATIIAQIREEGLERSRVWPLFTELVDGFGPRLTGSPAFNASAEWAREQLEEFGLSNARLEAFEFGPGWTLEKLTVEMIEPRYAPLLGYPRGWSPPTEGRIEGTPVMLAGLSDEQIEALRGRLRGAIVMTRAPVEQFIREDRLSPVNEATAERQEETEPASPEQEAEQERQRAERRRQAEARRALNDLIRDEGAAVILEPSRGEHGTVFVTGQSRDDENAVPTVVLAGEHYNMLARLLERGMPVRVAVEIGARFFRETTDSYNIIAEIPGADPEIGDEVVMIGAHLDSWHTATGATDNADGSAVAMEALRILKTLGVEPRRTIRIALWGGEEEGLLGSRAWVARHLDREANPDAFEKFSVYFNLDPGYGPVYGFFLEEMDEVRSWFEANLAPFSDLDADTLTMSGIGSTDHLSFIRAGLPGFQPIHAYDDYDVRTHHTNVDTLERVSEEDLRQASVVMASLLWHAAQRDEKFPRPVPGS